MNRCFDIQPLAGRQTVANTAPIKFNRLLRIEQHPAAANYAAAACMRKPQRQAP